MIFVAIISVCSLVHLQVVQDVLTQFVMWPEPPWWQDSAVLCLQHWLLALVHCLLFWSGKAASARDSLDNDTETGSMVSQRRERERPRRKHSNDHGQTDVCCAYRPACIGWASKALMTSPMNYIRCFYAADPMVFAHLVQIPWTCRETAMLAQRFDIWGLTNSYRWNNIMSGSE